MPRYEFLDSLRGIAIAGVVMTHVGQTISGLPAPVTSFALFGLRGVQLFFMVSALTLCLVSYGKDLDRRVFFIKRYFRIAPMFYLAGAFYLCAPLLSGISWSERGISLLDVTSTYLLLHGFNPHGINNVVPGGWSVASEAMFYAIFPVLILHARRPRTWLIITAATIILSVVNNAIPKLLDVRDPLWADFFHFNFLSNLPSFSAGILLFTILKSRKEAPLSPWLQGGGLLFVGFSVAVIGSLSSQMRGDQILMVPIFGVLVFISAVSAPKLIVNRPLSFLGEISFSIYLVHFAILHMLGDFAWTGWSPLARLISLYGATLAVSSLLAWGCYTWIERPMIKVGRRVSERFKSAQRPMAPDVLRLQSDR